MKNALVFLFLWCSHCAVSQKVAVVLSGGGAKGLAHAGVLMALEENNIPIDYIVGTSMGAVVGAFYAAGYSASDIVALGRSNELQDWIKNKPKNDYRYLQERESVNPAWVSLNLRIDSSFSATFGTHLSKDHFLNLELSRKLAAATKKSNGDFDKLFIPYRATASEIFTEKEIVLKSGNLYEAARASMAVPFIYRPVEINNKLLFDGGIYNNFPVEIARSEFNPDLTIGVNVASKKLKEYPYKKDNNLVAESLLFAILDKTDSAELRGDDVFIDVDLEDINALDFKEAKRIIQMGYNSAMDKMVEIKSKTGRRVSSAELESKRMDFKLKNESIYFDSLRINGFKKNQFRYITGRFDNTRPLSFNNIEEGYNKVVSDDYFENIFPSYTFSDQNVFTLSGNPNPRLRGKIGGSLISRNTSQLFVGFDFKRLTRVLTHYSIGVHTGRFYQSVHLKSTVQFPGKLELAIRPEFLYNRWNFISTTDIFSKRSKPEIQDTKDYSYGLHFELPVFKKMKLNFNASYFENQDMFSNNNILVSSDTLDNFELEGAKLQLKLYNNTLNFRQYAYSGRKFNVYANMVLADESYQAGNTSGLGSYQLSGSNWYRFGLEWEKYFSIIKHYSLGLSSTAVFSNQPPMATLRSTILNQVAFNPLQDSKTLVLGNFRGRKFLSLSLKNVFHLATSLQLRIEGHSLFHAETLDGIPGQSPNYKTDGHIRFSGTAGLVFQSLIGPVSLSLNYYDQPQQQWGGILHIGYLLFNKKSLD